MSFAEFKEEVKKAALIHATTFIPGILRGKHCTEGWKAHNVRGVASSARTSSSYSLVVDYEKGYWTDFSKDKGSKEGGGDYIDLYMQCRGVDFKTAVTEMASILGVQQKHERNVGKTMSAKELCENPIELIFESDLDTLDAYIDKQIAYLDNREALSHTFSDQWGYFNAEGGFELIVVRLDREDGSKTFMPVRKIQGQWRSVGYPKGHLRPLYNLKEFSDNQHVIFVEGEKAARLLRNKMKEDDCYKNCVVTTTLCGAQSPAKSDFSSVKGKSVRILRDNDIAGVSYAVEIHDLCKDAGAKSVKIMSLPEHWKEKDDIADHIYDYELLFTKQFDKVEDLRERLPKKEIKSVENTNTNTKNTDKIMPHYNADEVNKMSDADMFETKWLLPNFIPEHEACIIFGEGGIGKSLVTTNLAVMMATGERIEGIDFKFKKIKVGIINAEDDVNRRIIPTLVAAAQARGLSEDQTKEMLSNIVFPGLEFKEYEGKNFVSKFFELDKTIFSSTRIEQTKKTFKKLSDDGLKMLIIDPISEFGEDVDQYNVRDVRKKLDVFCGIARSCGISIVIIGHTKKGTASSLIESLSGSAAFTQKLRHITAVMADPDDDGNPYVVWGGAKTNIADSLDCIKFRFEQHNAVIKTDAWEKTIKNQPVLMCEGYSDRTINEIWIDKRAELAEIRKKTKQDVINNISESLSNFLDKKRGSQFTISEFCQYLSDCGIEESEYKRNTLTKCYFKKLGLTCTHNKAENIYYWKQPDFQSRSFEDVEVTEFRNGVYTKSIETTIVSVEKTGRDVEKNTKEDEDGYETRPKLELNDVPEHKTGKDVKENEMAKKKYAFDDDDEERTAIQSESEYDSWSELRKQREKIRKETDYEPETSDIVSVPKNGQYILRDNY